MGGLVTDHCGFGIRHPDYLALGLFGIKVDYSATEQRLTQQIQKKQKVIDTTNSVRTRLEEGLIDAGQVQS